MKIPGFLWTALLALIPLLIQWLGGDYFTGQSWAPWVIMALGFVAKAVEMWRQQHQLAGRWTYPAPDSHVISETRWARWRRFLLG